MPYHYSKTSNPHTVLFYMKDGKEKKFKLPEPMMKQKKTLSKRQKDLMKTHKEHHSKEHLKLMADLMKKGYCFEQSHEITMKTIGK
jgi:hypothetical protein